MMSHQASSSMGATSPSLLVLDVRALDGSATERRLFIEQLREACCDVGAFYLVNHSVPQSLCRKVLDQARAFFSLPSEDKVGLHIHNSEHFRGYSRMVNERDWREQMHLAREQSASPSLLAASGPSRLQGPNLWPVQLGKDWKRTMLSYLDAVGALSRQLFAAVEMAAKLPPGYFEQLAQDNPYWLMKLICYYPQPLGQPSRDGVAPHCDWSWLTFLLQDASGLEVRTRNGQWVEVPPLTDTLVINLGELMGIVTADYFYAAPHRVRNLSWDKPRIGIPVFINPSLQAVITPNLLADGRGKTPGLEQSEREDSIGHVHRVADLYKLMKPFVFGDSEWQRKGLGRWCYKTECCDTVYDSAQCKALR